MSTAMAAEQPEQGLHRRRGDEAIHLKTSKKEFIPSSWPDQHATPREPGA